MFMFHLSSYIILAIADLLGYIWTSPLTQLAKDHQVSLLYLLFGNAREFIYFGCMGASFIAFKKSKFSASKIWGIIPCIVTILFTIFYR